MSFEPILTPRIVQQVPDCTVATRIHRCNSRSHESLHLVFRFAGPFAKTAGLAQGTRWRAFWDSSTRHLRFASCLSSDENGRSILRCGGSVRELRFPHAGAFDQVAPRSIRRIALRVVDVSKGEITVDCSSITPKKPAHD